jgi:hypothetical protein
MPQLALLSDLDALPQLNGQLLKWIGNKYRSAGAIIGYFPSEFGTYYEPFLEVGRFWRLWLPSGRWELMCLVHWWRYGTG